VVQLAAERIEASSRRVIAMSTKRKPRPTVSMSNSRMKGSKLAPVHGTTDEYNVGPSLASVEEGEVDGSTASTDRTVTVHIMPLLLGLEEIKSQGGPIGGDSSLAGLALSSRSHGELVDSSRRRVDVPSPANGSTAPVYSHVAKKYASATSSELSHLMDIQNDDKKKESARNYNGNAVVVFVSDTARLDREVSALDELVFIGCRGIIARTI
jgi:hypothetical protein